MRITRRDALKGSIALALPATVALPALAGPSDARIETQTEAWWEAERAFDDASRIQDETDSELVRQEAEVAIQRSLDVSHRAWGALFSEHSKTQAGICSKVRVLLDDMRHGSAPERHDFAAESILADLDALAGRSA